ncbi:MAG: hypothetical protein FD128_2838, partial [Hyphomonadaceae bacterium]
MEKNRIAIARFIAIGICLIGVIFSIHLVTNAEAQNAQPQVSAAKAKTTVAGNSVNGSNVWSQQPGAQTNEAIISQQATEVFAQLKGGKVAAECSIILSKQSYLLIYSLLLFCFAIDCFVSTFIFTW